MKIRYLSGPKAGQEEHVENGVGRFAIGSGLAEQVQSREPGVVIPPMCKDGKPEEPPYRLPQPGDAKKLARKWQVGILEGATRSVVAITMTRGAETLHYIGLPGSIRTIGGVEPPKEIVSEYTKQWEANPTLRDHYLVPEVLRGIKQNQRAAEDAKYFKDSMAKGFVPISERPPKLAFDNDVNVIWEGVGAPDYVPEEGGAYIKGGLKK